MFVIVTVLNSSQSSAITSSSINFRRIENIMLSELLAFVQTSLLIKTALLCSKLLFAEAHGWGWNGRKTRKKRTVFRILKRHMTECKNTSQQERENSKNVVIYSFHNILTRMWVKNTSLHKNVITMLEIWAWKPSVNDMLKWSTKKNNFSIQHVGHVTQNENNRLRMHLI